MLSTDIRKKYLNMKFNENPSSGADPVRADGQTDSDGRTDMTKLIVAFGNFANAPKNAAVVWKLNNFEA
jgi:hypothetical protein